MTTTCRDALRAASGMLAQAGVPDPAVDAAFLLSHVTGTPHLLLRAEGWRELTPAQLDAYQALLDRRCQREPLQYILGTAQFMGVTLRAQPGALIPRNDTETLCEQALARMQGRERVLDLCTGTGALAIAIALRFPGAQVTAADISADALDVARQNIADTGARVTLRQGDLFAAAAGERFDIIVSNPPYITAEEMADLQPEVCREPALALYGGLDGLDFYRRIAREAPDYLSPGGWLLLEIGSAQAEAVSALLAERFEALAVYPDMQGLPRAVAARLRECEHIPLDCAIISIFRAICTLKWKKRHVYSPARLECRAGVCYNSTVW